MSGMRKLEPSRGEGEAPPEPSSLPSREDAARLPSREDAARLPSREDAARREPRPPGASSFVNRARWKASLRASGDARRRAGDSPAVAGAHDFAPAGGVNQKMNRL